MNASLLYRPSFLLAFSMLVPLSVVGGCSVLRSSMNDTSGEEAVRASQTLLTAEQIRNYPSAASVEDLLEQHFSSLIFRGVDERPGGDKNAYLLGSASPLFVVDGVPIDYMGSLGLNPSDVEKIELVKYGESAFYGFRGGSGAILITTRRN